MLADALGVQRALRPLKRRVPSRHRRELDEEATAARIADTRRWTPVLVPSPERWLTLSLVVDTGPTMRLWRPLARELAETLTRQGAFQDVHVSYLDETGRITPAPEAPPQDPRTLVDASGRHAVLVLSDCSGPHWWSGQAPRAVRHWAQAGPTAILQPLTERLWRRTAAPAAPGLAVLPRPGAPNTDLRFTPFDGGAMPGVPVPVLEVAPRWFAAWARLISGSGPQPAAVATLAARPAGPAPLRRERELPVAERVRRFLATASPHAAELAAHVAVSVPSLPVMRLIQHRILGGSGPGQLAEVLLSGLLRPVGDVRYEFVPGARDALLDTLPRPEALHTRHVLEAVSAEIERRAGTAAETFRALLPRDGGPVRLTADTDHFALITPGTRILLTPASSPGPGLPDLLSPPVEGLLRAWDGPPRETVIGRDGGGLVTLDVLHADPDLPHGLIVGPKPARDAMLRTVVLSLALAHSPDTLNFVFVDSARGAPFEGLNGLPHISAAVHADATDSMQLSYLVPALEDERIRRTTTLERAGFATWGEYQTAIANGAAYKPLPALVIVIDDTGPLLEARPDLLEALAWLCETTSHLGFRFIFCTPDDPPMAGSLTGHIGWNAGPRDDTGAFLHIFGDRAHPRFEPAQVPLDTIPPIIEQMRQRGPKAGRLPWPQEFPPHPPDSAASPTIPEFDVLRLNGGGPSGMFEETWELPASEPRNPAIGYDADGNVLTLYPLDSSSGIPHGLIVGTPEARQRIVRGIALALAAGHSPATLGFAFAGLGEHPLGEPLPLPHVRYSEEELLGRPEELQRFADFLLRELNARSAAPASETRPRLLVVADVSLTFPSSRPEIGDALLSMARRGRALDVQLLLTSTVIENTPIWDRFLPLLGWRVAAGPLPPAELQRVLGRAGLAFPDQRTAYLLAGGGTPHRFTVAEPPPAAAVESFLQRTHDRWQHAARVRDAGPGPADPERSRAVLIGVSGYTSLPDLPAVRNNLEGLKRALLNPQVWGLPERNCVVLAEPWSASQIVDAVDRAAREAEDALLVYYAGHGMRDEEDGTLSLALPASRPGEAHTALPYPWLLRAINTPDGPRQKVVLIDCRSSGRTVLDRRTESYPGGAMFVMSSAPGSESAPDAADSVSTDFTVELIATIEEGLTGAPADLDMRTIGDALRRRLLAKGQPPPECGYVGEGGASISLFRNRAHAGARPPEPTRAEVGTAIWERLAEEANTSRGDGLGNHHLAFLGRYGSEMEAAARLYGTMLADLGKVPHGDVTATSWRSLIGQDRADDSAEAGVLLMTDAGHMTTPAAGPMGVTAMEELSRRMSGRQNHPVIIMCGEAARMRALLALLPSAVADRVHVLAPPEWGAALPALPRHLPRSRLAMTTHGRIPIGVQDGTQTPAALDFREQPHLMVTGDPGSGRTNLLRLVFDALSGGDEELYVVDPSGELNDTDFTRPDPPRVSSAIYAATSSQTRSLVDRLIIQLETAPDDDVHLIIDDHDLLDARLFRRLARHIGGSRLHLVIARRDAASGDGTDRLLDLRDPRLWAVLRMGAPNAGERVPGRGVLTRRYDSRLIQVAAAF
jgi:hypothetical protein